MIPHNSTHITKSDRLAVDSIMKSGWIAQGKEVEALEKNFNQLFFDSTSCAVSSGTSALFLALRALGAKKNIEVAIPSYSCSALLNAVNMIGATPRIVDVTNDTFVIDHSSLVNLAPNSSIVIAVHTFGSRANIEMIKSLGVKVIEDCCHSLGGIYENQLIGQAGHVSIFSFYATKIITGGQGGLILSNNVDLIDSINDYREFDCREEYYPRFNFQMSDIQAAMIRSQLQRLNQIISRRYEIAQKYRENLPNNLICQEGVESEGSMVYRFVIRAPNKEFRNKLKTYLHNNKIQCIVPIKRDELLHRYLGIDPVNFPNSELLADTTLSIPIFPALTDNEIKYVSRMLKRFKL